MFLNQLTIPSAAGQPCDSSPYGDSLLGSFLESSIDSSTIGTPLDASLDLYEKPRTFQEMSHHELLAEMHRLESELTHREPLNTFPVRLSGHPYATPQTSYSSCSEAHVCQWRDCSLSFNSLDALVDHINLQHVGSGKSSYVCLWAGCDRHDRPFTKRHKVSTHLRTHTGERPFECPATDCCKKFARPDSLATHLKTHSANRPYYCPIPGCGKSFFHPRSLKKHEASHNMPGRLSMNYSSASDSCSSGYSSYASSPVDGASRKTSLSCSYSPYMPYADVVARRSSLWQSTAYPLN